MFQYDKVLTKKFNFLMCVCVYTYIHLTQIHKYLDKKIIYVYTNTN